MASSLTITVGTRTYTRTFNKTDTEVRTILRNFGASIEPPLPEGATIQQEVDDVGNKIVAMIVDVATAYDAQQRRSTAITGVQEQAKLANQL